MQERDASPAATADPGQIYLLTDQYRTGNNLNARFNLHERFSVNPRGWQRWVFDQLELPPSARVLELGAGPGLLWRTNRERIPAGWQLTLSDLSAGMLAEAAAGLPGLTNLVGLVQFDAQAIPFAEGSFDAVIANHMLYHVPQPAAAIAEVRRVLASDGRFYAATNGRRHLREIDALGARFYDRVMLQDGAGRFGLENGATLIGAAFGRVQLRRYEDALAITEPEPLLAYVRSARGGAHIPRETEEQMRAHIAAEIARRGAFHVTKETGLFVASAA